MKTKLLEKEENISLPSGISAGKVFSFRDIIPYVFKFTDGCSWDKLYRRDFVQQYHLQFQNLYRQNDVYFVLLSLCLAARITMLEEALIIHRRRVGKSTTDRRTKEPLCLIPAFLALKDELQRHQLYESLEKSYLNRVIEVSLWLLRPGIPSGLRAKMEQALPTQLFKKLNLWEKDKTFFYQPAYYDFLQRCRHFIPPTWYEKILSVRNSLDGRYTIIYLCGFALAFQKKGTH